MQGKPGDHLSHRGLRSMGPGLLDFLLTTTNNNPSVLIQDPTTFLFGWYVQHGDFPWLPTIIVYVSGDGDAQKIKLCPTQMTPCSDRPLPLLWWALDFGHSPLPTRFTWIPPLQVIVIAIVSVDDTRETHRVLRLYLQRMQHLVIYSRLFGKQKRLPVKSTPLFGTMELDQGEANVCIWQDTNKAEEVPFKKYSGLKHGRGKEREQKLKV